MMRIFDLIKRCDSWSKPIDTTQKDGRWAIRVHFDTRDDAKAFAEEILKVTISDPPYRGS